MGQATSEKNFVEEEKRILREKADWAVKYWHFITYLSFLCLLTKIHQKWIKKKTGFTAVYCLQQYDVCLVDQDSN